MLYLDRPTKYLVKNVSSLDKVRRHPDHSLYSFPSNPYTSRPHPRRSRQLFKSLLRLRSPLRQGSTRRLRSRCHNRAGGLSSTYLHPRQHDTFARYRVLSRIEISDKRRPLPRLRCRAFTDQHK